MKSVDFFDRLLKKTLGFHLPNLCLIETDVWDTAYLGVRSFKSLIYSVIETYLTLDTAKLKIRLPICHFVHATYRVKGVFLLIT